MASKKPQILFQDDDLLVVDKPSGVLSVAAPGARGPTLLELLAADGLTAFPAHRLDRDVSGLVLLARSARMQEQLFDLFRERALGKTYWALAQGRLPRSTGEYVDPILEERAFARVSARGKPSRTRWKVLAFHPSTSEVEVDLQTGRKNQVRVHFAHHGHALVGERKYARGSDDPYRFRRVALHAWRLAFDHPRSGARLELEAPLPPDLLELRARAATAPGRAASSP